MKKHNYMLYVLFLIVAVLSSQSLGEVAVMSNLKSPISACLVRLDKGKECSKTFTERDSRRENSIEIALSESRSIVNVNQEDFSLNDASDFEFHFSGRLNSRLKTIKTSIVFTKDLSQLQVLLI